MQKKTRRPPPSGLPNLGGESAASNGSSHTQAVGRALDTSKSTESETPFLAAAVQEDSGLATSGGVWSADHQDIISTAGQRGTDILVRFTPNGLCSASKIELTQTCAVTRHRKDAPKAGPAFGGSMHRRGRAVTGPGEERAATHIDRSDGYSSPFFGVDDPDVIQRKNETSQQHKAHKTYKEEQSRSGPGSREAGATSGTDAWLHDRVRQDWSEGDTMDSRYETVAIATDGPDKGIVYGSVVWGFKVDAGGAVTLKQLQVESVGNASPTFHEAMDKWNEQPSYDTATTINTARAGEPEKLVKSRNFRHENSDWTLPDSKIPVQASMPSTKEERAARTSEIDAAMDAIKTAKPEAFGTDLTYRQLAFEKRAIGTK